MHMHISKMSEISKCTHMGTWKDLQPVETGNMLHVQRYAWTIYLLFLNGLAFMSLVAKSWYKL